MIALLQQQYGSLEIKRHLDLNPTDCPGRLFHWEEFCLGLIQLKSKPNPDSWKQDLLYRAYQKGLISGPHHPDEPASKWFVLAVVQKLNPLK